MALFGNFWKIEFENKVDGAIALFIQDHSFRSLEERLVQQLLLNAAGGLLIDAGAAVEISQESSMKKRLKSLSVDQILKLVLIHVLWSLENVKETPFFNEEFSFDFEEVENFLLDIFSTVPNVESLVHSSSITEGDMTKLLAFYVINFFDVVGTDSSSVKIGFLAYKGKSFENSWDSTVRFIAEQLNES